MENEDKIIKLITFNPFFIGIGYHQMIYNQYENHEMVGRLRVRTWYIPFFIISISDTNVENHQLKML